jgi:hypothetical protein
MAKKYVVTLTDDEPIQLLALAGQGQVSARQLTRAMSCSRPTHAGGQAGSLPGYLGLQYVPRRALVLDDAVAGG